MKISVLLFATACLALSLEARAAESENGSMMLTVYKTVTATNHASEYQSLSRERMSPHTNSIQKIDSRKKEVELDDSPTVPKQHDIPAEKQVSENKTKLLKSIKKGSHVQSQNDEDIDPSNKLVPAEQGLFNSSAVGSSSDSSNSDGTDFTFRPITLAPENTKANGPKETAPLLSKPPIKFANVKNDRQLSSAIGLEPSLPFFNLSLVSVLIFAILAVPQ
ncbi:hypothetical protein [Absidia glauca]|uniref:Uncharacterized protein n=1 Tax=Absidia glauca TaxID=4829 RepID=A0A163IRF8_ABSGL|nr:hypothetical protein [Absidia glauca]